MDIPGHHSCGCDGRANAVPVPRPRAAAARLTDVNAAASIRLVCIQNSFHLRAASVAALVAQSFTPTPWKFLGKTVVHRAVSS
jgi:hypothetical protein